ncbi:putative aldo/keto reductase [Xylariaceae sp. FL0016]|nr:putative aldo/keto reductase [Xylariaceae sp. FL0016]
MQSSTTPLRQLGKDGPIVPALGLGTMGLSFMYGMPPSDEERFAVLDRALELGATHWDSSDWYGDSEELLGRWFKRTGKRDQIFLATKFGMVKGSPSFEIDSSAEACKKACDESLRILGVDYIDLYYMHRANVNTPIEETMRALAQLKADGKIKYIGVSEVGADTLRRACKVAQVNVVQTEYSAFERDIEGPGSGNLLAVCRELGVSVVCYSPLGRGMLTGTLNNKDSFLKEGDWRAMLPRFSGDAHDANIRLVSQFKTLSDKKGCTLAQLAIAWLLKQGNDIIPIPGTKKLKYLEENWGALKVELSDVEEKEIRGFLEDSKVQGIRMPEGALETNSYIDTRPE